MSSLTDRRFSGRIIPRLPVNDKGWTAVPAIVSDGDRRVWQIVDWTGGEGTKPTTGEYVGVSGLTSVIGDAVDVRGPEGAVATDDTDVSGYSWVLDEDDMASNSATKLATQQSIKAYVDGLSYLPTALNTLSGLGANVSYASDALAFAVDSVAFYGPTGVAGHSLPRVVVGNRDEATPDGAGGFVVFQSLSDAGTARDGVQLNGGLKDATDGAEDAVLDFILYKGGSTAIALAMDADLVALFPGDDDTWSLGTSTKQFTTGFFSEYVRTGVYTVAGLPAAGTAGAGAKAAVSDANATTFNSVVAGGGSNFVPVISDGTDWRIG